MELKYVRPVKYQGNFKQEEMEGVVKNVSATLIEVKAALIRLEESNYEVKKEIEKHPTPDRQSALSIYERFAETAKWYQQLKEINRAVTALCTNLAYVSKDLEKKNDLMTRRLH